MNKFFVSVFSLQTLVLLFSLSTSLIAKSDCHVDHNCIDKGSYGYCELVSNTHIVLSYDAVVGSPNIVPSVPVFIEGSLMSSIPANIAAGDTAVLSFKNAGGSSAGGTEGSFEIDVIGVDSKAIVSFYTSGALSKGDANKIIVRAMRGAENLRVSAVLERSDCKVVPRNIATQYVSNVPFLDIDSIPKRTKVIENAYYVPYDWVCRLVFGYVAP